jgi:APA family basic amino acid/polyamine antiporter
VLALVARPDEAAASTPLFVAGDRGRDIAVALVPVMFAYLGWNAATYVAGEIRDPQRSLGRALVLGTLVSTLVYLAINIVYVRSLPLTEMRTTQNVAAAALERLAGPRVTLALTALVAIAILSSLQATVLAGPRIYHAMAEDGLYFRPLGRLHAVTRVPVAGLAVQGLIACALLLSGKFEQLLTFTTFAIILFATLTVLGVFVLRARRPDLPRAFRVIGYPVTPALFVAANLWLMWNVLASGAKEAFVGLGIVAAGIPVYGWFCRRPAAA